MKTHRVSNCSQSILPVLALLATLAILFAGCAHDKNAAAMGKSADSVSMKEKWGVEPVSIRLTGGDHFIDFRYRVVDAEKAKPILSRDHKAYLEDSETGKVLTVPVTKLGTMRGTTVAPKVNKQYFILFANTGKLIERGRSVSVIVGDFRADGLTVQ